ncbi:MAG TPA: amidohydrolase family protein [Steroidobacteraceae bacterium]|nr:amidohydrolase family protein [Steroidobacteraceae bacterium]
MNTPQQPATLFNNALLFDGTSSEAAEGVNVLVEHGRIAHVTQDKLSAPGARIIDLHGKFLMPGLIDAHFHAYGVSMDVTKFDRMPPTLLAHHGAKMLEGALMRGFTTVRDAAGADYGLHRAVEIGLIPGPRVFFAGKSLSQTGGHGDLRPSEHVEACPCGYSGVLSVVVDGEDEVRKAAREELRQGAHQIKLHLSGGVLSPSDPLWMPQFSDAEIRAAVEEAATRRTYVMAHSHTADAAQRCVRLGIRSIEHGTLIDRQTARIVAQSECYVVPTLVVIERALEFGKLAGMSPLSLAKMQEVGQHGRQAFDYCVSEGVKIGFGTDLLGTLHPYQNAEFAIRRELTSALDVLKSATSVNAALLNRTGELGVVAPDARADLIVVDGDPLRDIHVLERGDQTIRMVMKAGVIYKDAL